MKIMFKVTGGTKLVKQNFKFRRCTKRLSSWPIYSKNKGECIFFREIRSVILYHCGGDTVY